MEQTTTEKTLAEIIRDREEWRERALVAESRANRLERKLAACRKRKDPFSKRHR